MKRIILFLFASLIVYATFFTEKDRLDREVKRLCAIDGGIKVYESVKLPAERFDQYGQISIPYKKNVKARDEYYYESSTVYLIRGNPEMWRSHYRVYRVYDSKFLGESVGYARVGGDIPGPWHSSSYSCPDKVDITDLKKQIFVEN
ncbi:hypothetical protein [Nitrosomonas oligotropha]|uniref:Uncharacterized protein n=1 Tax=Nitrosomonas oligotropha TaxID=42354 RepID=A0A1H8S2G2_9PROT|nr:hypothetical protein [Nitrosomonas oligotropha]SDX01436.1 hypothetical protein SAMN05216300_11567 [Nitrosomonas oligotropha]SEO73169.1 hypothetical protein SAMN05216333_11667 [Nitrosomonas oligotropha]